MGDLSVNFSGVEVNKIAIDLQKTLEETGEAETLLSFLSPTEATFLNQAGFSQFSIWLSDKLENIDPAQNGSSYHLLLLKISTRFALLPSVPEKECLSQLKYIFVARLLPDTSSFSLEESDLFHISDTVLSTAANSFWQTILSKKRKLFSSQESPAFKLCLEMIREQLKLATMLKL